MNRSYWWCVIIIGCAFSVTARAQLPAYQADIPYSPVVATEKTKLPGTCFLDGKKFCLGQVVGKGWLKCMAKVEEQLSDGCRLELTAIAEDWRNTFPDWVAVRKDCRKVLNEDCKRAALSQSKQAMLTCMKEFSMKLDNECRMSLNDYNFRKEGWDKKTKK